MSQNVKSAQGSELKKLDIGYVYLSRLNSVRLEEALTFMAHSSTKREMDCR